MLESARTKPGSVTELTKSRGSAVNTYYYGSFGDDSPASSETVSNPFHFTARERDSETKLYYYRARYYDPLFGRFLSEDPLGMKDEDSTYVYVDNDPALFRDPGGEQAQALAIPFGPPGWAVAGAITVAVVLATPQGRQATVDFLKALQSAAESVPRTVCKVPSFDELDKNCRPGRRLVQPATARRFRGGTSIEQEYICASGTYTGHTIIDRNGRIVHDHVRPGPPKGGGGED
jgi:RHS repeat-associated protein